MQSMAEEKGGSPTTEKVTPTPKKIIKKDDETKCFVSKKKKSEHKGTTSRPLTPGGHLPHAKKTGKVKGRNEMTKSQPNDNTMAKLFPFTKRINERNPGVTSKQKRRPKGAKRKHYYESLIRKEKVQIQEKSRFQIQSSSFS